MPAPPLPLDPKIGLVGCGAVGGYYGAKLAKDGCRVHFLLRSDYDVVRRQGLRILSAQEEFVVRPPCANRPEAIGPCDLVLVALKTTANAHLQSLLAPLLQRQTLVVTLQNGLGNEEALAEFHDATQILGGLCFVCLNRIEPGVVRHIDHGRIVLGEYHRRAEPRTHALSEMFLRAGVPCQVTENLERAHWEKLVWNIPFNGLGVASCAGYDALMRGAIDPGGRCGPCLTTDQLLSDARWEQLVRALMREIIAAAHALGFELEETLEDKMVANTRTMGPYRASTLVDFENGRPLELHSLFLEPLRRAQAKGIHSPRLSALCQVLRQLQGHP